MTDPKAQIESFVKQKIPLAALMEFSIDTLDDKQCIIFIPLNSVTVNHVQSMYFAALTAGADLACGVLAMHHIIQCGRNVVLVFKDFQAEFLKRADGDVEFFCDSGDEIKSLVEKTIESKERQDQTFHIIARLKNDPDSIVLNAKLTLSLKDYTK